MSAIRLSLTSPVEYIKGIGPLKGEILKKQLGIHKVADLIHYFPFRYIDKTILTPIREANQDGHWLQVKAKIISIEEKGHGKGKRIVAEIEDETGSMELIWFRSFDWIKNELELHTEYIFYGKISFQNRKATIAHPEIEKILDGADKTRYEPVYSSTEALQAKGLDARGFRRIISNAFSNMDRMELDETLPIYILEKLQLLSRSDSLYFIHLPKNEKQLTAAQNRLKFEELFFIQLRMVHAKMYRKKQMQGYPFPNVGQYFNQCYHQHMDFELTQAQKKVIKEIHADLKTGSQMNRLLQGDVGSGKTIVALLTMLIAIDNGYQACLMAPTEILANQHYSGIKKITEDLGLRCALLTSNVKGKERQEILENLCTGKIHILIGTHALVEDTVIFQKLALTVIDEQHRFGVEQRAKLWAKSHPHPPHVLVMTATPIPRTLAMSLYGDLDISVIDELPPNRKTIKTLHFTEALRGKLHHFMKEEIAKGRQVYIVFPLIEESAKLDLENLELGYEKLLTFFPLGPYQISVMHGRLKSSDKEAEMKRFVEGRTQIMVATTVIEVGVNVPNASIMVIENSERFGLSQLHQLRGRVGRGSDQSYCILMTSDFLGADAKARIQIMCQTNDGFKIAEADLRLRGPGDLEGTKQSGLMELKIADLVHDGPVLQTARKLAEAILTKDPDLKHPLNQLLRKKLDQMTEKYQLGRIG